MLPLYPFIAGIVVGAAALSLYRNPRTRDGLKDVKQRLDTKSAQTQETLRNAAVTGLGAIESSAARWRDRLQTASDAKAHEAPVVDATPTKNAATKNEAAKNTGRQAAKPAATGKTKP